MSLLLLLPLRAPVRPGKHGMELQLDGKMLSFWKTLACSCEALWSIPECRPFLFQMALPKGFTAPCKEEASSGPLGPSKGSLQPASSQQLPAEPSSIVSQPCTPRRPSAAGHPFKTVCCQLEKLNPNSCCQRAFSGQLRKLSSLGEEFPSEI